ncbi:hypothetical protein [Stenotrophomonas indicatrix]|uniref:hypothetical protein n=1 Tax=Stenotrophomonas indicatrix TaxID=2045451 RepID=UPI0011876693|nr:hypothetical protein [Stenotrophomonas indicatrix]
MPATIGGAGIGTGVALHFSGGSGAMSTVLRIAVVFEGLLRIGRLILRTRFGRQGLLRRNLITVFLLSTTPAKNFHIRRVPEALPAPADVPPRAPANTASRIVAAITCARTAKKKHLK